MSDMYEGVVFCSDKRDACQAFASLSFRLRLRLVRLAPGVFGIYRVAGRAEIFDDPQEVERVAKHMSATVGQAVALFYNNQCSFRAGALYSAGRRGREFGNGDAWWVPYGPGGKLVRNGPRFRLSELRPDIDYDCVFSAIEAALESVGAYPQVSGKLLIQAFCYEKRATLAESGSLAEPGSAAELPRD